MKGEVVEAQNCKAAHLRQPRETAATQELESPDPGMSADFTEAYCV